MVGVCQESGQRGGWGALPTSLVVVSAGEGTVPCFCFWPVVFACSSSEVAFGFLIFLCFVIYSLCQQHTHTHTHTYTHTPLSLVLYLLLFSRSVASNSLQPVDCSMPDFPVFHHLLEFAQILVHYGERNGKPLPYSCLENNMGKGAWQATVYGVSKNCTWLCDSHSLIHSCPLSQWCHPTISSSVPHFSSCPQSFPASGSFLMSQVFTKSGGQSIEASASASVLPIIFRVAFL